VKFQTEWIIIQSCTEGNLFQLVEGRANQRSQQLLSGWVFIAAYNFKKWNTLIGCTEQCVLTTHCEDLYLPSLMTPDFFPGGRRSTFTGLMHSWDGEMKSSKSVRVNLLAMLAWEKTKKWVYLLRALLGPWQLYYRPFNYLLIFWLRWKLAENWLKGVYISTSVRMTPVESFLNQTTNSKVMVESPNASYRSIIGWATLGSVWKS